MAYRSDFLGVKNKIVPPMPGESDQRIFEDNNLDSQDFYLEYHHFSLLHHPLRKLPYYTIANIDGSKFKALPRKDAWKFDSRIDRKFQLGSKLYSAEKSDFDKGHMTKREDVQWGENELEAKDAALSTFFYTNAVPQVDKLNRGVWSKIESYILHSETVEQQKKITLLTGPILDSNDPEFVTKVDGEVIKIPTLFWKIIYYINADNKLHHTAFIVNQKNILQERKIVEPVEISKDIFGKPFMDFQDAETYQIEVQLIEELSGFSFPKAIEVYDDPRPTQLIIEETEVISKSLDLENRIKIKNLKL